jgi:hypothetical protein
MATRYGFHICARIYVFDRFREFAGLSSSAASERHIELKGRGYRIHAKLLSLTM